MHPLLSSNAVRTVLMTPWPEALIRSQFLPERHLYFRGCAYREAIRTEAIWTQMKEFDAVVIRHPVR